MSTGVTSVLLEYTYQDTFMHRMHPITKLSMLLFFSFMINLYMDPLLLGLVMIILFWIGHKSRIPWKWYLVPLIITAVSIPISMWVGGMIFMFDASYYVVYSKYFDVGRIIVNLTPPGMPILGETAISIGSLLYLIQSTLHRFAPFQIVYIYLYTTSPSELCNVLAGYGVPNAVMFIITASLRFLTMIQRNTLLILNAQKLRGFSTKKTRDVRKIFQQYTPLIVPIARNMHEMTEGVTKAMEVRAFGGRKISPYAPYASSKKDIMMTIFWIAMTLVLVYLLLEYNIGRL